jgi:hypothetical protein
MRLIKTKVFLESAGNLQEREILKKFHEGVTLWAEANKNPVVDEETGTETTFLVQPEFDLYQGYSDCDVAVFLGSWKDRDRLHHQTRSSIANSAGTYVMIETPFLNRVMFEQSVQHRIGINGFLNNSGKFNYGNHRGDRLEKLGIKWKGWRNNPKGHILLMLQLPGDASLRGLNMWQWGEFAVQKLQKHSNREIVIRTHPGHHPKSIDELHKFISEIVLNYKNVRFSVGGKDNPISKDFEDAFCSVSYSSGSSIDSIISGIPTLTLDPANFAWDISSRYWEEIENIKKPSEVLVNSWLNNLAYSQWSVEEMQNGQAWGHLFPLIKSSLATNVNRRKKK